MPRKLLHIVITLLALAVPASARAGYTARRLTQARVSLGHHHFARAAQRPAVPAECPDADLAPDRGNLDAVRDAVLCLHNQVRARNGLPLLRANGRLRRAAEGHSADMVGRSYFEHTSPTGATMVDRIMASGYARPDRGWMLGENLEWGTGRLATPRGAVDAWMESPGHRANLLKRGYRHLGIGISLGVPDGGSAGVTYTVDFGARR